MCLYDNNNINNNDNNNDENNDNNGMVTQTSRFAGRSSAARAAWKTKRDWWSAYVTGYHGQNGQWKVSIPRTTPEISETYLRAVEELGYIRRVEINGREQEGRQARILDFGQGGAQWSFDPKGGPWAQNLLNIGVFPFAPKPPYWKDPWMCTVVFARLIRMFLSCRNSFKLPSSPLNSNLFPSCWFLSILQNVFNGDGPFCIVEKEQKNFSRVLFCAAMNEAHYCRVLKGTR